MQYDVLSSLCTYEITVRYEYVDVNAVPKLAGNRYVHLEKIVGPYQHLLTISSSMCSNEIVINKIAHFFTNLCCVILACSVRPYLSDEDTSLYNIGHENITKNGSKYSSIIKPNL